MHATAAAPSHSLMDATQFEDFAFPRQTLPDGGPAVLLGNTDHDIDIFSTGHPNPTAHLSARQGFATSMAGMGAHLTGDLSTDRRPSFAASDDGSEGSDHGQAHSLDETGADEFGLPGHGAADGTDLGGKSKDEKSDTTVPAWSELKTKAGKERKRLPLACIACRRKKIRCSGEKPACKHCIRSRIPCVYKVTTRKAAPRTDYMAMLDKRLKRMEERIIKIVPMKDQDASVSSVTRAVVKPALPGTNPSTKAGPKKRPADEAFGGPDLDTWAHGPPKTKAEGPEKPTSLQIQEEEENKLFLAGKDALPSKEIQEHLAEVFFENIYGQAYHLLHKPSYMRKLRAGALPPVLVLSVCAIAARFSTHPQLDSTPNFLRGEEWASHAREICTTRYEWPNITILTCLLILGLHEFGTCHGGRSWALGGQAIRMAFALQLHRDLEHDPLNPKGVSRLSFIDREIRRRVMWACFLMDRFNSSGTDRPTFIKEETIKIPLPIKEKYFQLDMPAPTETLKGDVPPSQFPEHDLLSDAKDNIGVAAYMIRTIALWGKIISYLNQGGKDMDPHPIWSPDSEYAKLAKEAEVILNTLPDSLTYNSDNLQLHDTENMTNQFLFLHIAIQQNILFLHRVAVATPGNSVSQDIPKTFVSQAGAKTFEAANRISDLLRDAEPYLVAAPFVGYCAFSCATIHVIGIFSGNASVEAASKKNLTVNVKYLSKMKRYWGMFHWMSENLRQQYRSCADAARTGGQAAAESSAASPIFQYGDWFDRYPHGVSQTDFLDPASYKERDKGDDAVLEQKPELHTVEEFFTSLSPPHSTAENVGAARSQTRKRRSFAVPRKKGSVSHSQGLTVAQQQPQHQQLQQKQQQQQQRHHQQQQQLEPLLTEFQPGMADHQSMASMTPSSQGRRMSEHQPGGFNPLQNSQAQGTAPYSALSPVSPVAINSAFDHSLGQPAPTSFYSPNLLNLSLSQQANGMLQPLDRQLVFGAYGMDPGGLGHQQSDIMDDAVGWEGLAATGEEPSAGGGVVQRPGLNGRVQQQTVLQGIGQQHPQHHQHHNQHHQQAQQAVPFNGGGHEASSAWFMPFNMEPPEIGDMGLNFDAFGGMFGGSMGTPGVMDAGGGEGGAGGGGHTAGRGHGVNG